MHHSDSIIFIFFSPSRAIYIFCFLYIVKLSFKQDALEILQKTTKKMLFICFTYEAI